LERIADRHSVVALADAHEDRSLPVRSVSDGALLAPDRLARPGRAAVGELAAVVEVALAPLRREVDFAGVAPDAAEARRRRLEPVDEVSAVARSRGAHA